MVIFSCECEWLVCNVISIQWGNIVRMLNSEPKNGEEIKKFRVTSGLNILSSLT